ncbi:hypothetical protein BB778_18590 [Pluralibacter gergoviae]|nr:hypothetical protein BB778_18590 [Pluralibacter gergoviae]
MVGYSTAIRQLDNGAYDEDLSSGMAMVQALLAAMDKGYYTPSEELELLMRRWLVAAVFIIEQMAKNGTTEAVNLDGELKTAAIYAGQNGAMTIFPRAERLTLANHIEALALEHYGEAGNQLAIEVYMAMVEVPEGVMRLSESASAMLSAHHDDFIRTLNHDGMPPKPTTH